MAVCRGITFPATGSLPHLPKSAFQLWSAAAGCEALLQPVARIEITAKLMNDFMRHHPSMITRLLLYRSIHCHQSMQSSCQPHSLHFNSKTGGSARKFLPCLRTTPQKHE